MNIPLRLLLIEDSEDDALLIVRDLKRAGYEPRYERVETTAAVRSALDRKAWDIIVSDFSMPHFNGIDALKLLRARDQDTPFIFVSGTIGEEVAVEAMRSGAQDYVIKGNLTRLVPAIERELRDVAARREHRAAEAARARLAAILEATTDFVGTADTDGQLRYLNQAGRRMLRIGQAEDLSGLTIADCFPERERSRLRSEVIPTVLQNGVWRGEAVFIARDGGEIPVSVVGLAHRSAADSQPFLSAIARDLTESKKLEEQFRQAQKMEAVGRLAGGVAHDFNNLLTVITSYAELLLEDLGSGDRQREDLEEIQKAAAGAAGLTRQLLAFSRQQVLEPRVLDLNTIVSGAEKMLQRLIGEDVALVTVLAPTLAAVKADPGQLEQVIMNLAVNARDAMPEGGKLTIETASVELDATYTTEHTPVDAGTYVLLSVSDSGVGMDQETKRRIFEPFFTTKEQGKGTGLGLATVYGIVKQSGGFIWAYSEPGQGTTFKIYLPRVEEPVTAIQHAALGLQSVHGTETVLLAEDAGPIRGVVRETLKRDGYTVLEAADGNSALTVAAAHDGPIHLLITDVVMPEMSGRQLAQRLGEQRPELRVLFVSGYTDDVVIRHGILEPGIAFLQKPFNPQSLAQKVREVLDSPRGVQ